jgi:hypothetical protein
MRKRILVSFLGLALITLFVLHASASWVLVPNGSFESGTVGLIPDNWKMRTYNYGMAGATHVNEMQQADSRYFEGGKSLWMHSRVVDTDGTNVMRWSRTIAETEDWINAPYATHVRIFVRDIRGTHSPLSWGWGNLVQLGVNNVSLPTVPIDGVYMDGEFLNFNNYNYTATGGDGYSWYVYEYPIPESVDKTHMKIQIGCHSGDWTFYDTSYFSDLEFVVDKVELLLAPPLSASISPLSASITVGNSVTFTSTVSGGTSPYSYQWYLDGNPVSGATSNSWTFTPTTSGIHYVYLKVTDNVGNTTQSETAQVTVAGAPVGGHSFLVERHMSEKPLTPYLTVTAAIAIGFIVIRRKTTKDS